MEKRVEKGGGDVKGKKGKKGQGFNKGSRECIRKN